MVFILSFSAAVVAAAAEKLQSVAQAKGSTGIHPGAEPSEIARLLPVGGGAALHLVQHLKIFQVNID